MDHAVVSCELPGPDPEFHRDATFLTPRAYPPVGAQNCRYTEGVPRAVGIARQVRRRYGPET